MFSLDSVLDDLWPQARPAPWQKSLLKRLFYEEEFQQFAAAHRHLKGLDMVEQVLEHLDILCTVSARDLEQIPEHGPLVIIANHPTGTLDGLALMYAVSRVRRDVKVVTNRMLTHLEPLSSLFIPVDNMGGRTAKSSLVQMEQHLQNAGVLIFFPAGEVSRPTRKGIRDKKWHSGFIKLASKLRAPLLPVHIQAHNSLLFYASTLVSPTLSMLLLMQQMFRRRHRRSVWVKPATVKPSTCGSATGRKRHLFCANWAACARLRFARWRKGAVNAGTPTATMTIICT